MEEKRSLRKRIWCCESRLGVGFVVSCFLVGVLRLVL
jgi:hypothetical protein